MLGRVDAFSKGITLTMPIKPSQALLAALALVAVPAFAQDAASPEPAGQPAQETQDAPAGEAPAAPQAPAEAAPAQGEPSAPPASDVPPASDAPPAADAAAAPTDNADPQVGQYYAKSTDDDWTTRCLKAEQGKDPCELYQLLQDDEGNSVAEMTVIPLTNGDVAAGATLVAPLETDLIQGLGFAVGNAEPNGYPFSFCAPVGCVSRLGFTEAEVTALKRGSTATVSLLPFGGDRENPVRLTVSLSGFTAAFDALAAYAAEPAPAADAPETEAPAAEAPAAEAPAEDAPAD